MHIGVNATTTGDLVLILEGNCKGGNSSLRPYVHFPKGACLKFYVLWNIK